MKKIYIEPVMVVEDFTVSEMVAATCVITPPEITVVSHMCATTPPCRDVKEYAGTPEYEVYMNLVDAYMGHYDTDCDGHGTDAGADGTVDDDNNVFTAAYRKISRCGRICTTDPFEHGINFVNGFLGGTKTVCGSQGETPLINS